MMGWGEGGGAKRGSRATRCRGPAVGSKKVVRWEGGSKSALILLRMIMSERIEVKRMEKGGEWRSQINGHTLT